MRQLVVEFALNAPRLSIIPPDGQRLITRRLVPQRPPVVQRRQIGRRWTGAGAG